MERDALPIAYRTYATVLRNSFLWPRRRSLWSNPIPPKKEEEKAAKGSKWQPTLHAPGSITTTVVTVLARAVITGELHASYNQCKSTVWLQDFRPADVSKHSSKGGDCITVI